MANKFRSSFEIKLNGVDYVLRPSFEAIAEFIDKTGIDVFEALRECSKGGKVKIIVAAIWAGIAGEYALQGNRDCPSYEKIGNECQSHGFPDCFKFAVDFLTKAVASDDTIKKLNETQTPPSQEE
jgi:hypothetical protein